MDLETKGSISEPQPTPDLWKFQPPLKSNILETLGSSLRRIPMGLWKENMLFTGADDKELKGKTIVFPAKVKRGKSTHPIFVLKRLGNFGYLVCPCTSKYHRGRYIKDGCLLQVTEEKTDRNSYLLEWLAFSVGNKDPVTKKLLFRGIVPEECICQT